MKIWPRHLNPSLANFYRYSALAQASIDPSTEVGRVTPDFYTHNSKNFRSPEFFNNPDILAIGCSQTWGVGVPDKNVWPKVLSDKLGMSYVNLAIPGASTMELVRVSMDYIEEYGPPKYLTILVPDVGRLYTFLNSYVNSSEQETPLEQNISLLDKSDGVGSIVFPLNAWIEKDSQVAALTAKYSKRPHLVNEVLGYEVPASQAILALEMLQRYCKAMSIELIISSWDDNAVDVYRTIELPNFYHIAYERDTIPDQAMYTNDCHSDQSSEYGINWYRGTDHSETKSGHIGIHRHLDYAEMFEREILEREKSKNGNS